MSKFKTITLFACVFLCGWSLVELKAQDTVDAKTRVKELIVKLDSSEYREQEKAAMELSRIGWPKAKAAMPALIKVMKQPDNENLRILAVEALGKFGPGAKSAVPELKRLEKRAYGPLRGAIRTALIKIGSVSNNDVANLIKVLQTPRATEGNKASAAKELGMMGAKAKSAIPLLASLLKSSNKSKSIFADALGNIDSEGTSVPALRTALRKSAQQIQSDGTIIKLHSNTELCISISNALGKMGVNAASAVPELIMVIKNANASDGWRSRSGREDAAEALVNIGPAAKAAIPALEACVELNAGDSANFYQDVISKIKGADNSTGGESSAGESE